LAQVQAGEVIHAVRGIHSSHQPIRWTGGAGDGSSNGGKTYTEFVIELKVDVKLFELPK